MGLTLLTERVFDMVPQESPEKFLRNYYDHLRDRDRIKYGNDPYNGSWAATQPVLHLVQRMQTSYVAAEEYAERSAEKWGPGLAIPYKGDILAYDASSKKIFDQVKSASQEVERRAEKIHAEVQNTKSKTKGCTVCHSAINRKYINRYCDCPVCGAKGNLMSTTQRNSLKVAIRKLEQLKKLKRNKIKHAGTCYLLAAVAPE